MAKVIGLDELSRELRKALASSDVEIKERLNKTVRMAAIKTFAKIIKMTPVGNQDLWVTKYPVRDYVGGRARSNWKIGNTIRDSTTISTNFKNRGAQYINDRIPRDVLSKKVYLYNNLPYINKLEYGSHSTQAPEGMVRISLLSWNTELNKAFKDSE